jgi:protein-S-isoprenylcysteine O-methyltransferase Ste14
MFTMKQTKSRKTAILSLAWGLWIALAITQTILSFFLFNTSGLRGLRYAGWLIWAVMCIFALVPVVTLRGKGGVPKGRSYVDTTILVDSGIYAVVRHPQYLGFILLSIFLILLAQHWLITVIGIAAMAVVYAGIVPQADQANIEKFGDDYNSYMQRVPRLNFVLGIIWLLRRQGCPDTK